MWTAGLMVRNFWLFVSKSYSKTVKSEHCIYWMWLSDWMFFTAFIWCDFLIGCFSLHLLDVTFWLDVFHCIYWMWLSDWMFFTAIYWMWLSDWMFFTAFIGCDFLIGCFSSKSTNLILKHTSNPIFFVD